MPMKLYSYHRSSVAYRIRIILNLKDLDYQLSPVNLLLSEHQKKHYRAINPQELVPTLELEDGRVITQSNAIVEWLETEYPNTPLLPKDNYAAASIRSFCNIIACDIHPLNNLRVLKYLEENFSIIKEEKITWYQHWVTTGFATIEQMIGASTYCFGNEPSLADTYLIPQVYNALKFKTDLSIYPKIERIYDQCNQLRAFVSAAPEQQPDHPGRL